MELITSRQGAAHITPMQDAMWHRGLTETENCIFNGFEEFAADIITNNEIRIRSGAGMLQGRFFVIPPNTYDSVTILNGSQGESRIDLIVCRITVDESTNTQNAELIAIQGTPAESDPVAPTPTTGNLDSGDLIADYPMYAVNINGITVESVAPQFIPGWTNTILDGVPRRELIWQNASPTSEFAAQTLPIQWQDYDEIDVVYALATTYTGYQRTERISCAVNNTINAIYESSTQSNTAPAVINVREIRLAENGIYFYNATIKSFTASASTITNTVCIPIAIYGIKNL